MTSYYIRMIIKIAGDCWMIEGIFIIFLSFLLDFIPIPLPFYIVLLYAILNPAIILFVIYFFLEFV